MSFESYKKGFSIYLQVEKNLSANTGDAKGRAFIPPVYDGAEHYR